MYVIKATEDASGIRFEVSGTWIYRATAEAILPAILEVSGLSNVTIEEV